MTRETKIALLVGLVFIICFGVILGEARTDRMPPVRPTVTAAVDLAKGEPCAAVGPAPRATGPAIGPLAPVQPTGTIGATVPPPPPPAPVQQAAATPEPSRAPTTAPAAAPARQLYRVAAKDTLYSIAGKVYGRGNERHYQLIQQANPGLNPAGLRVGQELVIPPMPGATRVMDGQSLRDYLGQTPSGAAPRPDGKAVTPAPAAAASPTAAPPAARPAARTAEAVPSARPVRGRAYTIRPGDSLTGIARAQMKDSSTAAVQRLYEANRGRLGSRDRLSPGTVLVIPN